MSIKNSSFTIISQQSKTPIKNNEEKSVGSTTNHDSLHNTRNTLIKSFKTENKEIMKKSNFFMALKSLQNSVDINNDNDFLERINEYSETNPNQTKEENISKYLHRPLVKEIIKNGNNLDIIKPLTSFGTSINNPYIFNYNLGDIIDSFRTTRKGNHNIFKDIKKRNINKQINFNNTTINNNKYKKYFNGQKNNNFKIEINKKTNKKVDIDCQNKINFCSTNIKPFYVKKIIDDLEKSVDIKVKDYEQTKINNKKIKY